MFFFDEFEGIENATSFVCVFQCFEAIKTHGRILLPGCFGKDLQVELEDFSISENE